MEWYRKVQFISAVPMPPEWVEEFGTTVNGMWGTPEDRTAEDVREARRLGRRVLFSVAMVALTPRVWDDPRTAFLLDEVCRDIGGRPSECGWYYWERRPVYAACIYSEPFRRYLLDRCRRGVDLGMDVVNLDEIMTSVGLMNRDPRGTGFCSRCLARFREHLRANGDEQLASTDDEGLRDRLWCDDDLYRGYRAFHEREAHRVVISFIDELRAYADRVNPGFAISANVAYLGNLVERFGTLWGCFWASRLSFILMENDYRITHDGAHHLLPRGKFVAWYRLGSALAGAPTWICPSINVPRQLAGQPRSRYYELMFLEAYAYGGRWGYYWWPGVDAATRRRATAPDVLKDHIRFIAAHRDLYERAVPVNDLAVAYLSGPMLRRPASHVKYLALAQALVELGFQFDVIYVGDGEFEPDELAAEALARYRTILVPEARDLGSAPAAALEAYAASGGDLIVFSEAPLQEARVRWEDGALLTGFWVEYRAEQRDRIGETVGHLSHARIEVSDPAVTAVRYVLDDTQIVHLLNYGYDPDTDTVRPALDVRVSIPWSGAPPTCTLSDLHGNVELERRCEAGRLVTFVPAVDPYAVLVLRERAA